MAQTQDVADPVKERARQAIEDSGWSMRRASTEWLGRPKNYLEWALKGRKAPLSEADLHRIAERTTVDVDWLKTGKERPAAFTGPRDLELKSATTVGGVAQIQGEEFIERPPMLAGVARSFAIRVADDRLKPRYRRNDVLYFHGGQIPDTEDCVALELPNGRTVVGIFVQNNRDGITLKSLSPEEYHTYNGAHSVAREVGVLRG